MVLAVPMLKEAMMLFSYTCINVKEATAWIVLCHAYHVLIKIPVHHLFM